MVIQYFFMVISIVIDGKNEMISPRFSSTVSINGCHQSSWLIREIIPKWPYLSLFQVSELLLLLLFTQKNEVELRELPSGELTFCHGKSPNF